MYLEICINLEIFIYLGTSELQKCCSVDMYKSRGIYKSRDTYISRGIYKSRDIYISRHVRNPP